MSINNFITNQPTAVIARPRSGRSNPLKDKVDCFGIAKAIPRNDESGGFDDQYMRQALELARKAKDGDDIPVGALVLDPESQEVIGSGYNMGNVAHDPTLHAEIIAIKQACSKRSSKFLKGCYMYVTLEPCAMCAAAISYTQLARLYYGASDDKFGAVDSNIRIYNSSLTLWVPEVYGGILRAESVSLLKEYFALKR